jgi:CBS domain containing-hemolysin-like protein
VSDAVSSDPSSSNRDAAGEPHELTAPAREADAARPSGDNWLARAIRTLLGWRSGSLRADLETVLETSHPDEIGFTTAERAMLRNVLDLRERRIADVMVQRADIIAVREDISLGDLMKQFESAALSRLVVYRETLDDPEGMVHIRDLLAYITSRSQVDPEANTRRKRPLPANLDLRSIDLSMPLAHAGIVRKLLYVPPSMPAIDLLAQMQATRVHLALVVDEYGGTDGLVSIEDLVEQIVGQIDDEHDDDTPPSIVKQPDNSFIADARAPIEDVIAVIGPAFDPGEAASTVDTIGGYLVAQVGRLPARGEVIAGPDSFEIEVLDADPRRLKLLRISVRKELPVPRGRTQRRRTASPGAAPSPSAAAAAGSDGKPSNNGADET